MALKLQKLSVLIVEDVKPISDLLKGVLGMIGVGKIYVANNGVKALVTVCDKNPDIIICDWEMPEMNGISLTHSVRTSALVPNKMVPIIMLSGYGVAERIGIARDSGVTEFLVKPFKVNDLAKRIEHVINKPRDYIMSDIFTGPDRRRSVGQSYIGPYKRSGDRKHDDNIEVSFR